jgi:putative Holliday junction resolvase
LTNSQRKGAVIAIDHGTKRVGFAVGDALRISALALEPWEARSARLTLLDHIERLVSERTVSTLLVGVPCDAAGSADLESSRVREVAAFVRELRARFPAIDVVAYDERLTTKAAEDLLREAGHHGDARKRRRDSWSALVLLRDWIASGEPR